MSQDFMDPEIFADFIIEAREHLETIEPNLLELEKTPDNLGLLNEIFRPMHSLKGASGFLGLNKMNGLAHKAENILDELRKGSMSVTSEIMDVILASTDALRQMIESLEATNSEGDVDTAPIIGTLDAIMAGEMPSSPVGAKASAPAEMLGETPVEEPKAVAEPETVAETTATAPPPEVAAPEAAPTSGSGEQGASSAEWIASREEGAPYALTAFGEAHLRDFIEEARENTGSLNVGLLELEKHPDQDSMVNDLFRYFHNLKGNSGIIGFQEMNRVTHEAETLLNSVRHGNKAVSRELVDLLLLVVDVLEALIASINPADGKVTPFDVNELIDKLSQAVGGGAIELPDSLRGPTQGTAEPIEPAFHAAGDEDLAIFKDTVSQQHKNIAIALKSLREDGTNRDFIDGLYRSLVSIQNSAGFMGLDEIKVYAQRTAGIVDQGRISGLDFSLMVDLLDQECAILKET